MPPLDKAVRRDKHRRKAIDSKFQGVRYNTSRSGDALVAYEAERKTKADGKPVRRIKRK
ncbi:MAG: hypothetical protein ABJA50_08000 [Chloroflexota bacterium]